LTTGARIIVSGAIAKYHMGGTTWHHLQYVLGLARLGYDVYYLEDTRTHARHPPKGGREASSAEARSAYLARVMERYELGERWAYCDKHGAWAGLPNERRRAVISSADLLVNLSGLLARPEAYREVPRLAFVDTDPVFNQIKLAEGDPVFRAMVDVHDVHFSFGERLAETAFDTAHHWIPTRQPVVLVEWSCPSPPRDVFSTIMSWRVRSSNRVHAGGEYGEKDMELLRFIDLPDRVAPAKLELALNRGKGHHAPLELLASKGWRLVDPNEACPDLDGYRAYIQSSLAEWSIAKNGYVQGQPGWFSERSACYLAAGRPTVVQDTGFSSILPVGEGLLAFRTVEEAAEAIRDVAGRYDRHSEAARAIARDHFDSDKVLAGLIEHALA
jgi:hypothetical protein